MSKNREHYIGARFTLEEKEFVKKIAEKRDMSLSDLLREAVFSHIRFLERNWKFIEKSKEFKDVDIIIPL